MNFKMKRITFILFLTGFGSAGWAQAKETRVECANLVSPDQFMALIGETGRPKFIEMRNKGCNYLNEAETKNLSWTVSRLSTDREWTQMRDGLKMASTYGMNLATTVDGVGADAYEQGPILLYLSSNRKYKVSVIYAEKGGAKTPPETQAAIRKEIALDLDKAVSKL